MNTCLRIGDKVAAKREHISYASARLPTSYFTGTVAGHGVVDGELMVLVRLDKKYQGYIDPDNREVTVAVGYVTMIVSHPDNIEKA